jgi:hypothetical protein
LAGKDLDKVHASFLCDQKVIFWRPLKMWYIERYQPDGKQPYLLAHLDDFASLRKMLTNRRRDRIEIVAPMDARDVDIKKLRSLGVVRVQMKRRGRRL